MARNVFYSFHYHNDINRVMVVRNRWVTQGSQTVSGVIDSADFEKVQKKGDKAVENWIDEQLKGTSVTVVLIGAETLKRPYVHYEICESLKKGNAIIGVYINKIKDMKTGKTSSACPRHTVIGYYKDDKPAYFDDVADAIYDYVDGDGYNNLGDWVEEAVSKQS